MKWVDLKSGPIPTEQGLYLISGEDGLLFHSLVYWVKSTYGDGGDFQSHGHGPNQKKYDAVRYYCKVRAPSEDA